MKGDSYENSRTKTIIDLLDDEVEVTIFRQPPEKPKNPIGVQVPEVEAALKEVSNEVK